MNAGSLQNHIVVDVIETGFSGRLDACQENGRAGEAAVSPRRKIHVPGVDFLKKEIL